MAKPAKPGAERRATRSNIPVSLQLGEYMLEGSVSMYLTTVPGNDKSDNAAAGLVTICPECKGHALKGEYHCPDGHGPFTSSEALRGIVNPDGTVTVVGTPETLKATTGELPQNLRLRVVSTETLDPATSFADKMYVLKPAGPFRLFTMLFEALDEHGLLTAPDGSTHALIGEVALRNNLMLCRVTRWQGQLALIPLNRPETVIAFEPPHLMEVTEELVKTFRNALVTNSVPFDPAEWTNERRMHLIQTVEAIATAGGTQAERPSKPEPSFDESVLLAQLRRSVEATTKARKPKTTSKKKVS